jgi:pimeloyl-ACP methyl ester carboxylesterase
MDVPKASLQKAGWMFQKRAFRKHFQVITFDNRGIGNTDKTVEPYSIKTMADDTVGLMDYLDVEKAHICGMSMGGMVAQEIAINYPERVNKLVLVSTVARMENTGQSLDDVRKVTMANLPISFNKRLYRMLIIPMMIQLRFGDMTGIRGQMEAEGSHDTVDRLQNIRAETLVIIGTKDKLFAVSESEVLASRIANSTLVKVEGGSHGLVVEMRGRFNKEVLDFLRDNSITA